MIDPQRDRKAQSKPQPAARHIGTRGRRQTARTDAAAALLLPIRRRCVSITKGRDRRGGDGADWDQGEAAGWTMPKEEDFPAMSSPGTERASAAEG